MTDGAGGAVDTEVNEANRLAMSETEFWSLISVLHDSNSDAAYRRLEVKLESLPSCDLVPFEARLDLSLYALDDRARVEWYEAHDPTGLRVLEADDFLYVRANTVSAGQAVWKQAIETDTLPWGHTDAVNSDGEPLLEVAHDAAIHDGVSESTWTAETGFDDIIETASNPAGWPSGS
jgi:hypothetical protein